MDELSAYAYELCKNSISVDTVDDWLDFLQTLRSPPSASGSGAVSPEGVATPGLPPLPSNPHELHHAQFGVGPSPTNGVSPPSSPSSVFGRYGPRLRDDVFQFLVSTLPEQFAAANPGNPVAVTSDLTDVYVRLPFEYFKAAVESPDFPIGMCVYLYLFLRTAFVAVPWRGTSARTSFASTRLRSLECVWLSSTSLILLLLAKGNSQERFRFAKSVVAARKRGIARDAEGMTHSLDCVSVRFLTAGL